MSFVNIVTSDRGWILETLARETAARLPYIAFGDGPRRDAAIQYYITHSCRTRRLSPVELAFFTHLEADPATRAQLLATARAVDHRICQSAPAAEALRQAGLEPLTIIAPGVDTARFRPELRVGVIGRTYHTGRKGEHLVEAVRDLPGLAFVFTGGGWPEAGEAVPPEALPALYRSLDCVLVPALNEGGPMCVIEALACGVPVVAPPIGWVPDYPHIPYRTGDAADLRRVLAGLLAEKQARHDAVARQSWDAWAVAHDRVFQDLARAVGLALGPPPAAPPPRRVGLILHGNERVAQGGPSVRVPHLARELAATGTPAELRHHPAPEGLRGLDLVHVFNSWPDWSAPDAMRRARASGAAVVFSPILIPHGFADMWGQALPRLFAASAPGAATEAALAGFRERLAARRAEGRWVEPAPGFHSAVREMAGLADRLIVLGGAERARLAALGAAVDHARVVPNPVDAARFAGADPAAFRAAVGMRDFVLCVARIEPRKNQLMLVHALRDTGLPLVLLGHGTDAAYLAALEAHAGEGVRLMPRLPTDSPLLASAFAAARVFALPSWAEGAPLAALEAAASGAALVLSDESGERELFGAQARYADPVDPAALRAAVLEAWETPRDQAAVAAQQRRIAEDFSWERHRAATEAVHAEAIAAARARPAPPRTAPRRRAGVLPVLFDLTTTANHRGRWTGIARVEAALALALLDDPRAAVRLIAWNNAARAFVEIPASALREGRVAEALAEHDAAPRPVVDPPAGAALFVGGSGWMQNALYAERLVAFARGNGLRLAVLIHDVIPPRFPFWFAEGYAPVFTHNLRLLLDGAEMLFAVSEATRRELEAFAFGFPDLALPAVAVLREGDDIGTAGEGAAAVAARFADRPFVLCVGASHARKNHRLLHDVWLKLVPEMGARCPDLVIVGGAAWNGQELVRAFREDQRLDGRVSVLEDVDDAALGWLYRNCLFSVYPSLHEGWGLPVAESLAHGRPCLAADIPSVREIAPGLVELLDPLDVARWAARIRFLAGSAAARDAAAARIVAEYRRFTWRDSAAALLGHLAASRDLPRPARTYTLGAVVPMGDRIGASRLRFGGWHPFEKWGFWAEAPRAALRFAPNETPGGTLLLLAAARAVARPGESFAVRVLANGSPVADWRVPGGAVQVFHALIPREIAAARPEIEVAFESERLAVVREISNAEDDRTVGIGLAQVALAPLSAVTDAADYFEMARPEQRRLALGERLMLQRDPSARAWLAGAWQGAAAWGMWSTDPGARLDLVLLDQPGRDIELLLRVRPIATAAAPLVLQALVNGAACAAFTFTESEPADLVLHVPGPLRAARQPMTVELRPDVPRGPSALGLGAAEAAFSFGLIACTACLAGAAAGGRRLDLAPGQARQVIAGDPALAAILGPDWFPPEPGGAWSAGRTARLPLRLLPPRGAAVLQIDLQTLLPAPGAAEVAVSVSAGGAALLRRSLPPRRAATLEIEVPEAAIGADGALDLDIAVDAATSPFAAGSGRDERLLGFRLGAVRRAG